MHTLQAGSISIERMTKRARQSERSYRQGRRECVHAAALAAIFACAFYTLAESIFILTRRLQRTLEKISEYQLK